jgi:leucyl aminopeptidase
VSWAHFDIFAWSPKEKPHAPVGGEAQAIRALFDVVSSVIRPEAGPLPCVPMLFRSK